MRQHTQVRPRLRSLAADVDAVDAGPAFIRGQHAVQHAETRGLAGPVRSQESRDLPVARDEGHVAHGLDAAKSLAQAEGLYHGAGPVILMKKGSATCSLRQLASSLSGAAVSRNAAVMRGMHPVPSW